MPEVYSFELDNSYQQPVVVCSAQYFNNETPFVVRVSTVAYTSFDVWLQSPSNAQVQPESVSCVVVEEGVWNLDGVVVEAHTYMSEITDNANSWTGESQQYGQSYVNPVVLGQVMSDKDLNWSVFWSAGSRRSEPPSPDALVTGKTVAEDPNTIRADETIGFIVFEGGHGYIDGIEYEAAVGNNTVRSVTNAPPYTYDFDVPFFVMPQGTIAIMAGVKGANGGWAQTYGGDPVSTSSLALSIDEDQLSDSERNHIREQVAYVVFAP